MFKRFFSIMLIFLFLVTPPTTFVFAEGFDDFDSANLDSGNRGSGNLDSGDFDGDFDFDELDDLGLGLDFDELDDDDDVFRGIPAKYTKLLELWKKGQGARSRDPLFLVPARRMMFDRSGFYANFFFNMGDKLPVYPGLTFNMAALTELQGMMGDNPAITQDNSSLVGTLLKFLPFIRKMTVQERRIGSLFQFGFRMKNFVFGLDLPILFAERNFWLCKNDQKVIKDLIKELDIKGGNDMFMKTRWGLGDARLKLGYDFSPHCSKRLKFAAGVEAIIPTSKMGQKKTCTSRQAKAGDSRMDLLVDLLRVGRDIMVEPKLGIGHWGAGVWGHAKFSLIPDKLDIWARASFDYLFEGNEDRFMPSTRAVQFMDLMQLMQDKIPADFPLDALFPCLVQARVKPGHIFNGAIGLDWAFAKNWNFGFGYDLYIQGAEKITGICSDTVDPSILITDSCLSGRLVQHKLFSEVSYTKKGKSVDWHFGLGGDVTFSSQNTAKDWTVFGKFGISF